MCDIDGHETEASAASLEDQIVVAQDTLQEILEMLGEAWAENDQLKKELESLRSAASRTQTTASGGEPAGKSAAPQPPPVQSKHQGVLIIDDSRILQMRIKSLIESLGYDIVGIAADGAIGVNQALARHPRLVILDYVMPVLNGLDCLKLIRQQDPAIKVIICASDLTSTLSQAFKRAGADDIVTKPINLHKFITAVRRCMDGAN